MMRQVSSTVRRGARRKGQQWTSLVAYPAINVVMSNEPKMLLGLGQKGHCSGYRGGKKRRPPCNGADTGCAKALATSPDAQAGRLPCGVSARESRRNRHRRCCKCRWTCATGATFPSHSANAQAVHGCFMELSWASTSVSY